MELALGPPAHPRLSQQAIVDGAASLLRSLYADTDPQDDTVVAELATEKEESVVQ